MRTLLRTWARRILRDDIDAQLDDAKREAYAAGFRSGIAHRVIRGQDLSQLELDALMARGKPRNVAFLDCLFKGSGVARRKART